MLLLSPSGSLRILRKIEKMKKNLGEKKMKSKMKQKKKKEKKEKEKEINTQPNQNKE